MRRYILRQYMQGEPGHAPSSVTGTFDELKKAQAFAGMRLCDFNEVIDSDSWEVVWRLNKRSVRGTTEPLQLAIELPDWQRTPGRIH